MGGMTGERLSEDQCRHREVEPVVSGGETVAHLCLICDEQLPAEWVDRYAEARAQVARLAAQSRRLEASIANLRRKHRDEETV